MAESKDRNRAPELDVAHGADTADPADTPDAAAPLPCARIDALPDRWSVGCIDRRRFLGASAGLLLWPLAGAARAEKSSPLSVDTRRALAASRYVYISPLRSDGEESRCHGEVWFGWIDGAVVVNTSPDRWNAAIIPQ